MNITGSRVLNAPRAAAFAAILDPATLLAVIPGCSEIEKVNDAEYRGQIALRLPGAAGRYRIVVRLVAADPPASGRLQGEVAGPLGSISGTAYFRLAEDGDRTAVEYDGQAVIDGPLARLDSRFVEDLAGSLIGQGLERLDAQLQRDPAGTPA